MSSWLGHGKVSKQQVIHVYDGIFYNQRNKLTQYSKDEGVGEVSVEGELHQVASDAKSSCGLHQRHEYPPADGSIQYS